MTYFKSIKQLENERRQENQDAVARSEPMFLDIIAEADDGFNELLENHTPHETPLELFYERRRGFAEILNRLRSL